MGSPCPFKRLGDVSFESPCKILETGNNCKSICIFEICQDAEANSNIGPGGRNQQLGNPGTDVEDLPCVSDHTNDSRCTVIFEEQSGLDITSKQGINITKTGSRSEYENIKFSDQHDPYLYDMGGSVDPTREVCDMNDASLENFFSRPIKIFDTEWAVGGTMFEKFDPWSLYFGNKRVINRIANYNLLRAKLRVKIVINGNGFQYGRAIASYLPFDTLDSLSANSVLVPETLVQASQQPHVFLDPTTSTGGEMVIPFHYHRNYIEIPESEWDLMGTITMRSINALKHANGADDFVTVSVFAWAEDVSINVLTSRDPSTLLPQSGLETEGDEVNRKGIISGPATTVSKLAGKLKGVPSIGSFATATELGAQAVADVAKAIGYCRPTVTRAPDLFTPRSAAPLALTNTGDTANKLSVDEKQELTIDPRIAGLGPADPMNIVGIATRESYLTTFSWAQGTAPETLLWNSRVTPVNWVESAGGSYHFPACAAAALPFEYWTGRMKFRFQIVCSAFHKGRIKVVYDPQFLAGNEYNTNYLEIVDIADMTDFTIEVGNGQPYSLIDHARPGSDSVTTVHSTTPFISKEPGNGVIGVYVVNELTTPNSTVNNDIEVNVFISAGDDFEVFVPDNHFQNFVFKEQSGLETIDEPRPRNDEAYDRSGRELFETSYKQMHQARRKRKRAMKLERQKALREGKMDEYKKKFKPQSGVETLAPESQNTAEPSAPEQVMTESVGPHNDVTGLVNKVFTGESISSFRTMLKRYNLHSNLAVNSADHNILAGRRSMFPYLRGYVNDAVDRTTAEVPYNYCNTVLMHWVMYMHSGWRGSVRWKILPRGNLYPDAQTTYSIQRGPSNELEFDRRVFDFDFGFDSPSEAARSSVQNILGNGTTAVINNLSGTRGLAFQSGYVNPNVEFEVPYYSPYRFTPAKIQSYTGTAFYTPTWDYYIQGETDYSTVYDMWCAAGEDFQVFFYTGLPPMYFESAPPIASGLT